MREVLCYIAGQWLVLKSRPFMISSWSTWLLVRGWGEQTSQQGSWAVKEFPKLNTQGLGQVGMGKAKIQSLESEPKFRQWFLDHGSGRVTLSFPPTPPQEAEHCQWNPVIDKPSRWCFIPISMLLSLWESQHFFLEAHNRPLKASCLIPGHQHHLLTYRSTVLFSWPCFLSGPGFSLPICLFYSWEVPWFMSKEQQGAKWLALFCQSYLCPTSSPF